MKRQNPYRFYVYEHWRPDLDVCFYVGKGRGRRAYIFKRNRYYNNVVVKLSRLGMCAEVRLVAESLSERKAFILETERIAFWRAEGVELANATDGGEGPSGWKRSAKHTAAILAVLQGVPRTLEVKAKIKAKLIGRKFPERGPKISAKNKGRVLTDEHKKKLALAQAKVMSRPGVRENLSRKFTGRKHTPEVCAIIGNAHRGKVVSEETKAKQREAARHRIRKPMSAETKAKIGAKVSAVAKRKREEKEKAQ